MMSSWMRGKSAALRISFASSAIGYQQYLSTRDSRRFSVAAGIACFCAQGFYEQKEVARPSLY